MKKMMLQTILLCCLCMASCSDIEENRPLLPPDTEQEDPETPDRPQDYTELISKTNPVPAVYEQEAEQRGEVVRIDYDTYDYAEGTGVARTNTAYVYLPYGYDENTNQHYNVLYFVHGHYGTASTTFEAENGLVRKLLDHMTENGDMAPTIVVSPSYNYGNPTPNYVDADPYCEALPQELINDLIPIVESRYRTYAESTGRRRFRILARASCHRRLLDGGCNDVVRVRAYAGLFQILHARQCRLLVAGSICRYESPDGNGRVPCWCHSPISTCGYGLLYLGGKRDGRFGLS